jgi:hypothetical protein
VTPVGFWIVNILWVTAVLYCRYRIIKAEAAAGVEVGKIVSFVFYRPISPDGNRFRRAAIAVIIFGSCAFLSLAPLLAWLQRTFMGIKG